jgi:hypothetical protein
MDLRVNLTKGQFEDLHGKELGWELIKPAIQQVRGRSLEKKKEVYESLTPGQKSLFSFWILHGHTQAGWIQFFLEGYTQYIPVIRHGFAQIDDQAMLANLHAAEQLFADHTQSLETGSFSPEKPFPADRNKRTDWNSLRQKFVPLDHALWLNLDETIQKLEEYIRANPDQFVIFTL